jgi:hypothetical protein
MRFMSVDTIQPTGVSIEVSVIGAKREQEAKANQNPSPLKKPRAKKTPVWFDDYFLADSRDTIMMSE